MELIVAKHLGLPADHIFANRLLFDEANEFLGFDESEPTSRSGGKPVAVQRIADRLNASTVVLIGDGITDLEARPPAKLFIGYGGVVQREPVKENADWFVNHFDEISNVLDELNGSTASRQ